MVRKVSKRRVGEVRKKKKVAVVGGGGVGSIRG